LKPKLIAFALALAGASITGCREPQLVWESGEVTKITGTLPSLVRSGDAASKDESAKIIEPTLIYTVRTEKGAIYTLNIIEGQRVARATLLPRVCEGTTIRFLTRVPGKGDENLEVAVGSESADSIRVPEPCKNKK